MCDPDHFQTLGQPSSAEYKDRGSRFIAYAFPISNTGEFKKHLQELKKEHPKAAHHCFAYRLGTDSNNFRSSDDGEPSGSAGKPILNQIQSKGLTNVLVVVVRYFGGTLLGVPGLINAYKIAAMLALQLSPVVQKPLTTSCTLNFDYTMMNEVMRHIKAYNVEIISQEMQLFCNMRLEVPVKRLHEFEHVIKELRNVDLKKQFNN
ncbi:MAG: YigZ family protein [Chitinophagaceae bacterium]|nr:YigZ family protein [Chitinophagaceae bacterium]